MELVIINELTKKQKIVKNPQFIPRLNEKIIWDYEPAPTVTSVGYDFDANIVVVVIK